MRLGTNIVGLALIAGIISPVKTQETQGAIALERTICFGACPAYLLRIDSSGAVSFQQGPPSNRHENRTSRVTLAQFADLMTDVTSSHFFELNDVYEPTHTDGPQTYIQCYDCENHEADCTF